MTSDGGSHLDLDFGNGAWNLDPWSSRVSCLQWAFEEANAGNLCCARQYISSCSAEEEHLSFNIHSHCCLCGEERVPAGESGREWARSSYMAPSLSPWGGYGLDEGSGGYLVSSGYKRDMTVWEEGRKSRSRRKMAEYRPPSLVIHAKPY